MIGVWVLLLTLTRWDNSRGELVPRWRALGAGPRGFAEELMLTAQPASLGFIVGVLLLILGGGDLPFFSTLVPSIPVRVVWGSDQCALRWIFVCGGTLLLPTLIAIKAVFRPTSYPGGTVVGTSRVPSASSWATRV